MVVVPRNATDQNDITRPRIWGELSSCRMLLPSDEKLIELIPTSTITIAGEQQAGHEGRRQDRQPEQQGGAHQLVGRYAFPAGEEDPSDGRPEAHGASQERVAAGIPLECELGDQRQADLEFEGERTDDGHHQQAGAQDRRGDHVLESLHEAGPSARGTGGVRSSSSARIIPSMMTTAM